MMHWEGCEEEKVMLGNAAGSHAKEGRLQSLYLSRGCRRKLDSKYWQAIHQHRAQETKYYHGEWTPLMAHLARF